MADVFVAIARGPAGFNKLAVVKRLRNAGDPAHVRMFLDEARLSARLSHPNIVNTYEVGESKGNHFMAMEYLDGQPLAALLAKVDTPLPEPLVAFIGAQALRALHYAHELCGYDGTSLGVVHRDVSPQNLFLTFGGEVKLLDFGIAKASVNATRTDTGVLKGKIRYMAPEQVGEKDVDRRVDIFALGIVLWEMLARRQLFEGDSYSVLTRIATAEVPPLRSVRPDVSPELEAIVARALLRDREQRYATAAEMQLELERFVRGKEDDARDTAVARVMNGALAEKRDKVRARIQAFLSALGTEQEAEATELGPSADNLPPLMGEGSGPRRSPLPTTNASLRPSHKSAKTDILMPKPRGSSRGAIIAAAAVVAAGALVAMFALRARPPETTRADAPPAVAPSLAHVHVESTPPGAQIEASGKVLGETPADFAIEPGAQTLHLTRDGYETETISLDVKPGGSIDRAVALRVAAPPPSPPPSASAPPAPPAPPRAATALHTRPSGPKPSPAPSASAAHLKIKVLDDSP